MDRDNALKESRRKALKEKIEWYVFKAHFEGTALSKIQIEDLRECLNLLYVYGASAVNMDFLTCVLILDKNECAFFDTEILNKARATVKII